MNIQPALYFYGQIPFVLSVDNNGDLLYIVGDDGTRMMHKYSFKKRTDTEVTDMDGYDLTTDGKKMLYATGGKYFISNAGEKADKGPINTDAIQARKAAFLRSVNRNVG